MADETEPKKDILSFDDNKTAARFYNTFFYLYDGLSEEQREKLQSAIIQQKQDGLDEQTQLVYVAGSVILLQEYRRPNTFTDPDYKGRIADYLKIPLETIDDWQRQVVREQEHAQGAQVVDDSPALPGFEAETEAKQERLNIPPYIYHDKTIIPLTLLSRTLHSLKLTDLDKETAEETGVEKGAIAVLPIDAAPHKKNIYMILLNKLAEEYPVTAADKNMLIAMGNLYGERKNDKRYTGPNGGVLMTAEDIIRRERGLDSTARIDPASIIEKQERMNILRGLTISLDFTQHFEYRKKDIDEGVELDIPDDLREVDKENGTLIRFSFHGNMVHADIWEGEYSTGRIVKVYEFLSPPIVYDYAMKIKQVATIETKLLDLRKKANGSRDADVMKVYLLERILAMIDPKTHRPKVDFSHTIKLDKLFEDLRIDVQNRKTKKVKVDTLKKILDHFKETEDKHRGTFIRGYKEQKGYRGAVTGYEILF